MPPPTPRWVQPCVAVAEHGERADGDGEVGVAGRSVSIQPERAAVDAPPHRLEVLDGLEHPRLGRAGDRRRRERRLDQRAGADVVAQPAAHRAHEVVQPRVRLDRAQRRARGSTRVRTPGRGRCGRGRRSSRSRRGPWRWPASAARVAAVPLIGRVSTTRRRTAQEALRRRRDHRGARPDGREMQQRRCAAPGACARARRTARSGRAARSQVSRRVRFTW